MQISARKIFNNGNKKIIGKFPSLKMKTSIWWESQLERDYIYFLEIDPTVIAYYSQPFKIGFQVGEKTHVYTPDFFVIRNDKKQVIEIKPEKRINDLKNQFIFSNVKPICLEQGCEFKVITDKTIRSQPRLNNIKLLHKYSRMALLPQHHIICHEVFLNKKEVAFAQIEHYFQVKGITKQYIYALIYKGILAIDITKPINKSSMIRLSNTIFEVAEEVS